MILSGRDVINTERMNHCLPTSRQIVVYLQMKSWAHTFSSQNLSNAVLLTQESLLIDLIQKERFAIPRRNGGQVLLALIFRAHIAHLDYHKDVFIYWTGSEQYIRVERTRGAFDTITEMLDQ